MKFKNFKKIKRKQEEIVFLIESQLAMIELADKFNHWSRKEKEKLFYIDQALQSLKAELSKLEIKETAHGEALITYGIIEVTYSNYHSLVLEKYHLAVKKTIKRNEEYIVSYIKTKLCDYFFDLKNNVCS